MSDQTGRSKEIETRALVAKLSPAGRRRYLELILAKDFSVFLRKVFATVSPGNEFLPNWHIEAMTFFADRIIAGRLKRAIVTIPPRHLKSIIFSVALPARFPQDTCQPRKGHPE